jgi:hypothetical protein
MVMSVAASEPATFLARAAGGSTSGREATADIDVVESKVGDLAGDFQLKSTMPGMATFAGKNATVRYGAHRMRLLGGVGAAGEAGVTVDQVEREDEATTDDRAGRRRGARWAGIPLDGIDRLLVDERITLGAPGRPVRSGGTPSPPTAGRPASACSSSGPMTTPARRRAPSPRGSKPRSMRCGEDWHGTLRSPRRSGSRASSTASRRPIVPCRCPTRCLRSVTGCAPTSACSISLAACSR